MPGPQTYDCLYRKFAEPKLPYSVRLFGQWTFFADAKEINPFNPKGKTVRNYKNTISGSFSWNKTPISILISNGEVIVNSSCHYWIKDRQGKSLPESVLWYNKDGTYGISQVAFTWELPDVDNIIWAVGGAGLLPGDADEEGFIGVYGDIWRKTSHMVIGFDSSGYFTAVECQYMNGSQIKALIKKLGLTHAILLDGGHVTASNVDARGFNRYQAQYYAIHLGG